MVNGTERTDDTDRDLGYRDGARDTSGCRDKPQSSHQKNNNYADHLQFLREVRHGVLLHASGKSRRGRGTRSLTVRNPAPRPRRDILIVRNHVPSPRWHILTVRNPEPRPRRHILTISDHDRAPGRGFQMNLHTKSDNYMYLCTRIV